ncbi:MAG: polysaccharide pyruvyl transferase family protein [Hyphomicrobium sp.]|nr:polysaccharide pyruvyl transferase family protein [Hyphomicrobium sp.]
MAHQRPRVLLLGDHRSVGHHGSSSVIKVILDELERRGIDGVSSPKVARLASDPSLLKARSINGVLINAEGALHGQSKHALGFARIVEACKENGLPCFLINAVLDGCDREVTDKLRKVSGMFCRENRSKAEADSLGIPAQVCPDLTFALHLPDGLSWIPGAKGLVTDSTLAETNQILHRFATMHALSYLPLRAAPHITSYTDRSVSRALKFAVRRGVGQFFRGNFQADRYGCAVASVEQFLRQISSNTKFVITGRFHGVCFCLKVGVPFLAVRSNTYKVEGLLEDAGFTDRLVSIDALGDRDLSVKLLDTAANWSEADELNRCRYIKFAEVSIRACFDNIASTIGKH